MSISDKTIQQLQKAAREQSENELWHQIRLGRLTKTKNKKKTTPLAAQIRFGGPNLKTQATTWGI